jgi:hypothetical protein
MEGSDIVDEGETKIVVDEESGQEVEVETGFGWNPESKSKEMYEEIWRLAVTTSNYISAQLTD